MATRKRKPVSSNRPIFKVSKTEPAEETDLKKVRAQVLKELKKNDDNKKDWYDNELDKNLKKA
jgi:hypothetical protein